MPAETIRRVADEDRVPKEAHGNGRVVTASRLPFLSQLDNKHSRGGAVLTGHQANHTGKPTVRRLSRHHVTLRFAFSLSVLPSHPNPRTLCAAIAIACMHAQAMSWLLLPAGGPPGYAAGDDVQDRHASGMCEPGGAADRRSRGKNARLPLDPMPAVSSDPRQPRKPPAGGNCPHLAATPSPPLREAANLGTRKAHQANRPRHPSSQNSFLAVTRTRRAQQSHPPVDTYGGKAVS